jgi:Flp pilus assembly pilin Flp
MQCIARASSEQQKEKQMKRLIGYFKDERGVETLEWIVVGALIVAVGIAVYTGALQGQLITAVNAIGGRISGLASS